jgi:hypothetical protein
MEFFLHYINVLGEPRITTKEPPYSLDRRLGGPQGRSGGHGEVKILKSTGTRIAKRVDQNSDVSYAFLF